MRYFVTGRTGTIGSKINLPCSNFQFDLRDQSKLKEWVSTDDAIGGSLIHLAAVVGEQQVKNDTQYSFKVNVESAIELGALALESGIERFFFTSTSHIYGNKFDAITEDDKIEPQNLYAEQKLKAEEGLREIFVNNEEKLVILRVFSVLDLGTAEYTLGGVVTKALNSKVNYEIRNSNDVRDFMTPNSVAKSIEKCVLSYLRGGIYNICTGSGYTVRQAIEMLLKAHKYSPTNLTFKEETSNSPRVVGSNSKVTNEIPLLKDTLTWQY